MSDLNTVKKFCHLGGVLSYLQKIHKYRTDTIHKIDSTFRYIYNTNSIDNKTCILKNISLFQAAKPEQNE